MSYYFKLNDILFVVILVRLLPAPPTFTRPIQPGWGGAGNKATVVTVFLSYNRSETDNLHNMQDSHFREGPLYSHIQCA